MGQAILGKLPRTAPRRARKSAASQSWWRRARAHPSWPWVKRIVLGGFALFVISALVFQARAVDWEQVFRTMAAYPVTTLALALGLAATSHGLYSCFDLIGRRYTRHKLANRSVLAITFVSYAFNLNLGTIVGAVAMRYRLYSRLGLNTATITRVVVTSMVTNWLGYLCLAGVLFAWMPMDLPDNWHVTTFALRGIGVVLLAIAGAYLAMCAFSKSRHVTIRKTRIALPSLRMALVQLAIGMANWSVMGAIMYVLLGGKVPYALALGVLLTGAVAGLLSRVPAGLGVLEAVFVAFFSSTVPVAQLLAAVLTYRAVYYWTPLLAATLLYTWMEARAKALRAADNPEPAKE